ncbi:MAG TPA: DUF4252 domain-containing protein [Bryobacteraceae bacterium]
MKRMGSRSLLAIVLILPAWCADAIKWPASFERLAKQAKESVDVTLDSSMLQLAGGFLEKGDAEERHVKELVSKLKGVYVKSFEFDKEGQYSMADVESIRSQLTGWSRIVAVRSVNSENTDVYLKKTGDQIDGLFIIDAEPKELTVVHIDGPIRPEDLNELGGHMGIPKIGPMHGQDKNTRKDGKAASPETRSHADNFDDRGGE